MLSRRSFFASAAAAAVSGRAAWASAPRASVVTTTGMIADTVRQIAGDLVQVQSLMGAGIDPHSYRQTRTDIVALTRADLVFWNGLYLEAQMEDFLISLQRRVPVVAVGEAVAEDSRLANEDYPDRFDPHVWMDPVLWSTVATRIADALVQHLPQSAAPLRANAAAFQADLRALDVYAHQVLDSIPTQARVLVSAHDAFSYFGRAFGFDVVGIQGISTESEAGLNRIAELVDLLVSRNIGAVFVESSVSDRNIRALIEGAAARGHQVRIGGELFSDAMGAPGTYEGTYLGMIDHNVTTIARALGGDAPERGMAGKLMA